MERRKTPPLTTAMLAGLLLCGIVNMAQSANMSAIQAKNYALEAKRKTDEALAINALDNRIKLLEAQKKDLEGVKARYLDKMSATDVMNNKIIKFLKIP